MSIANHNIGDFICYSLIVCIEIQICIENLHRNISLHEVTFNLHDVNYGQIYR